MAQDRPESNYEPAKKHSKITAKDKAEEGIDFFVTYIYNKTGRAYQYSEAKRLAINQIEKMILIYNDPYLQEIKQELEKI